MLVPIVIFALIELDHSPVSSSNAKTEVVPAPNSKLENKVAYILLIQGEFVLSSKNLLNEFFFRLVTFSFDFVLVLIIFAMHHNNLLTHGA